MIVNYNNNTPEDEVSPMKMVSQERKCIQNEDANTNKRQPN